jgi:hypothetical protein
VALRARALGLEPAARPAWPPPPPRPAFELADPLQHALAEQLPLGRAEAAAQFRQHQVQQVVLLQLTGDLAVVAGSLGARRRVEQLVLDRRVGDQGPADGVDGAVLSGEAALGVLVGVEPPLDALVQRHQHTGGVGRGVEVDRVEGLVRG